MGVTLEKVLRPRVRSAAGMRKFMVVNDGSSDNTVEIVRRFAEQESAAAAARKSGQPGQGIQRAQWHAARAGRSCCCSAMPISPRPSKRRTNFSRASPAERTSPLAHAGCAANCRPSGSRSTASFSDASSTWLLRLILGLNFKDTQCGFKAFTRRAAATIFPLQKIERWGFDPELLYLAKKFKLKVAEVPVAWAHSEGTRISPAARRNQDVSGNAEDPLECAQRKIQPIR